MSSSGAVMFGKQAWGKTSKPAQATNRYKEREDKKMTLTTFLTITIGSSILGFALAGIDYGIHSLITKIRK